MKVTGSSTQRGIKRLQQKTFNAVLSAELRKQLPTLGQMLSDKLASHLEKLFLEFFPSKQHIQMGQLVWPAVAKEATGSYGEHLRDTPMKAVVLNLLNNNDFDRIVRGVNRQKIRQLIAVRLFDEAYQQGGVLTEVDVAAIMGLTDNTISKHIVDFEANNDRVVPRRGTVHDMGPSVTHKRQICYRIVVLGQSTEQTARETNHSPESVTRYVQDYRRITHCLANGFSIPETAFAAKLSPKLVAEYARLIDDFKKKENDPNDSEPL